MTHLHYDHICNLDDVLMSAWNNTDQFSPPVFGPKGTAEIVSAYLNRVYRLDIQTRLSESFGQSGSIQDIRHLARVRDIGPGLVRETEKWRVTAAGVEHMYGLGVSRQDWKCLGYRVEAGGKSIAISGDTVDCKGLQSLARGVDLLVLCCHLATAEIDSPDWEKLVELTLACAPQAGKIATRAGVKKLVLTHFKPKSEELMASIKKDVERDFKGEVVIGEDLMGIEV